MRRGYTEPLFFADVLFAVVRLACDVMHLALGVLSFWLFWQILKFGDDEDLHVKGFVTGLMITALFGIRCFTSVDKRWGWNFLFIQDLFSWILFDSSDGEGDGSDGGGDGGD